MRVSLPTGSQRARIVFNESRAPIMAAGCLKRAWHEVQAGRKSGLPAVLREPRVDLVPRDIKQNRREISAPCPATHPAEPSKP